MPLGVISRVHLDFGVIFGKKSQNGKLEKFGQNGLLRRNVGCLAPARPRCPKWHPFSTPRRSFATLQRKHCS